MLLSLQGRFPPAILALADGTVFVGNSIGTVGVTSGEVVFNTSITGYQEILTDPSYCQQIVTLTYPHIGNTGANPEDVESAKIYASGLVIRDLPLLASNFRKSQDLSAYLREHDVVAISDIDTRQLTRVLRERGAQDGCLMAGHIDVEAALKAARAKEPVAPEDKIVHLNWDSLQTSGRALRGGERLAAASRAAVEVRLLRGIAVERGGDGFRRHRHLVHGAVFKVAELLGMADDEVRVAAHVAGVGADRAEIGRAHV